MQYPLLKLKKNENRRLLAGHLWVFSNEVDVNSTPLRQFSPGDFVTIIGHDNKPIGNGYVNPNSLICARLLTRHAHQTIDRQLLANRIQQALQLRNLLFPKPYYRLVFGESDLLPGLTIDRFDNVLVVQITTAGMDSLTQYIIDALDELICPDTIILNNDTGARELENLPRNIDIVKGDPGDQLQLEENQCRFNFPTLKGQKTGWFYDHRSNRHRLLKYVAEKTVLDVFSYLGGWGIQAAVAGARQVDCVETSASACELIKENAKLNEVDDKVSCIQSDAFDALSKLRKDGKQYDVIVLDPPAFIKRKKDLKAGSLAYERINKMAVSLLVEGGILVSASCSFHLHPEQHLKILRQSTKKTPYQLQIVENGSISPDHPTHPAIPETDYLSCFFSRKITY